MSNEIEKMNDTTMSFTTSGNGVFAMVPDTPYPRQKRLPAAIYEVVIDKDGNIFFTHVMERYSEPSRIYGNVEENANLIIGAHIENINEGRPTGVILHGMKGTGKTQLAERVANKAMDELGIPTLQIKTKLPPSVYNTVLRECSPCVLFIDEIDRIHMDEYRNVNLDAYVSIIGSSTSAGVLTMVTTNRLSLLPDVFINRPTRFMFRVAYGALDMGVVAEVLKEHNLGEEFLQYLYTRRHVMTFDLLNTYIKLFKKAGSIEAFNRVADLYNLPTAESIVIKIASIRDTKISRNLRFDSNSYSPENGTAILDIGDGDEAITIPIHEYATLENIGRVISWVSPCGRIEVIFEVSVNNKDDDDELIDVRDKTWASNEAVYKSFKARAVNAADI